MTRYIAIDHNSGYLWGDAEADTPEAACVAIDRQAGSYDHHAYERTTPIRDTDGGYHLYIAPADWPEFYDGQDQTLIDRIDQSAVYVGDYQGVTDAAD